MVERSDLHQDLVSGRKLEIPKLQIIRNIVISTDRSDIHTIRNNV